MTSINKELRESGLRARAQQKRARKLERRKQAENQSENEPRKNPGAVLQGITAEGELNVSLQHDPKE